MLQTRGFTSECILKIGVWPAQVVFINTLEMCGLPSFPPRGKRVTWEEPVRAEPQLLSFQGWLVSSEPRFPHL